MTTRLFTTHLLVLVCLSALASAQPQTPPDAGLGEPVRIPISDEDVAQHMSRQELDEWRRYRREGQQLEDEAERLARAGADHGGSVERQAMLDMRRQLIDEFRRDFEPFFGISGTTVLGFGEPLPTGREIAGEMLELRSSGWDGALPRYWVRAEPGDLQGFFEDPRNMRQRDQLGPAAGREARMSTRFEDRNRPAAAGGSAAAPDCSRAPGPFGLSGCP